MKDITVTETGKDNPVEPKRDLTEKKITVSECRKRCREIVDNRVYPEFRAKTENNQKKIKTLTTGLLLVSGALIVSIIALIMIILSNKTEVKK